MTMVFAMTTGDSYTSICYEASTYVLTHSDKIRHLIFIFDEEHILTQNVSAWFSILRLTTGGTITPHIKTSLQ